MTPQDLAAMLRSALRRSALEPRCLGYLLNRDRQREERSPERQQEALQIDPRSYVWLHLERIPETEERVWVIAERYGCDGEELGRIAEHTPRLR